MPHELSEVIETQSRVGLPFYGAEGHWSMETSFFLLECEAFRDGDDSGYIIKVVLQSIGTLLNGGSWGGLMSNQRLPIFQGSKTP